MYEEAWELLQIHIKKVEEKYKNEMRKKEAKSSLKKVKATLAEQIEAGFDDDDPDEVDYRKIYKTIMCPLKE